MKSKELLKSKNLQNSIWNIAEVILSPLILFVSIPFFLNQLGDEDYGVWMFVNSVIIVFQTFNLGLNYSTYKHVSESISEQDNKLVKTTLNVNLTLNNLIFLVVIIGISILALLIHEFDYFIDNQVVKVKLISCVFIGAIIIYSKLTEQILYNVYRAFENFKYVTIISIVVKLVTVLGNIIIAYTTQNIIYILMFTATAAIVGLVFNFYQLIKFIPNYNYKFELSKILIKKEIKYSFFIWLQSIAVIITYQGDRFLVSYEFGLAILTLYAIVATLFNHIHMVFGAITAWIFPQIAKNKVDKDYVFKMYQTSRNISIVISVFSLCVFSLLVEPIFSLWLGFEKYSQMADFIKWFTIFEFFFVFTIIPNYFLNASDHEKYNLKMIIMYTSFNLIGILVGLFLFNSIVTMLIGLVISTIISMIVLHFSISKKFNTKQKNISHTIFLFIPSFLGSGTAFFDNYNYKLLSFLVCMISIFFIYVKHYKTNFKLLTE